MNEQEIIYRGLTGEVLHDDDPQSPLEWDNLGTMVCWHSRYTLGDNHNFNDSGEANEYFEEQKAVVLPIFMYDHGGIAISTGNSSYPFNCRWDSGQVGYIYVTRERIESEYGEITPEIMETVEKVLQGEVATYNSYLQGEIYGYTIKDTEGEILDSCFGFYGHDDALVELEEQLKYQWRCVYPLLAIVEDKKERAQND